MLGENLDASIISQLMELVERGDEIVVKTSEFASVLNRLETDFGEFSRRCEDTNLVLSVCIATQWLLERSKAVVGELLRDPRKDSLSHDIAAALCSASETIARDIRDFVIG